MNSTDESRLFATDSDSDNPVTDRARRNTTPDPGGERNYNRFEEQEYDYEEPDRDTDCVTIYTEEDDDDEYYLDEPEPVETDIFSRREAARDDRELQAREDWVEDEEDEREREQAWESGAAEDSDDDRWEEADSPRRDTAISTASLTTRRDMRDTDFDWEEDAYGEETVEESGAWPLSLIAVAVVAVLLLAAGGYGVLQQRAGLEEEIRQLQADLATAVTPAEAAAGREAARDLEAQNSRLQARVDALTLENHRLEETVAGLESRLREQPATVTETDAAPTATPVANAPVSTPKPAPARPIPTGSRPAAAGRATGGGWFVNFGSYSRKEMADSWAARLQSPEGKVVVTSGSRDGERFYRVRVVDLANREQAERTARRLEADYGLSRLWVGTD